jgi:hypothetical protein
MPAREYLVLTSETVYGVYNGSGTVTVIDLRSENAFTPRTTPNIWSERSAGGSNRMVQQGTEQAGIAGKLTTRFFPSQGKVIMPYILGITGSPYNLPSFTADHAIVLDDGSATIKTRYLGGMVKGCSLKSVNTGTAPLVGLDLDLVFQMPTTTTFTEPTWATTPALPTDDPFAFQDTKAGIVIATVTRVNYMSFNLNITNILRTPFDENKYISSARWSGRDVSFDINFRYLSNADRVIYENQTVQAVAVAFFDGTNTGTFSCNGANFIKNCNDSLPWGDPGFYQQLTYDNLVDTTVPMDISYAQTP